MSIKLIHYNFIITNTYKGGSILEFQLFGNTFESISKALYIGGFMSLWENANEEDKSVRILNMGENFVNNGLYPITVTSEKFSEFIITNQELAWSVTTFGYITEDDDVTNHKTAFEEVMEIIEKNFGKNVSVLDILKHLMNKEIQTNIGVNSPN